MLTLSTFKITKNVPFQMYLLSDPAVKKMLREFEFYNVRFYREERAPELTTCIDYPTGNMYWYCDFKKAVMESILTKPIGYIDEWNALLRALKADIKRQFDSFSLRLHGITQAQVVHTMNTYNLRDYQAFDMLQLLLKMRQNSNVPAGLILSEQRTGKTRIAVAAVCELYPTADVMVVCPKSAVAGWAAEFTEMNRYMRSVMRKEPYSVQIYKRMKDFATVSVTEHAYNVKIVSYDLFKRFTYAQQRKATGVNQNVILIGDEVHRLRNFGTLQSDAMYTFKAGCLKDGKHLSIIGITGTPAVKSSSDVFGSFSLINTSKIGFQAYVKDFNQFKEYFYNCEDTSYGKVCKTLKRTHELAFLEQSVSVQTKQRDLELFKGYTKEYAPVYLAMDPDQSKIYESVKDTFEYEDDIDCANPMIQLMRLQQICTDPSALVASYEGVAPKIKWITTFALTKKVKFIVMSKKLAPLDSLEKAFNSAGIQYRRIDGTTTLSERLKNVEDFRTMRNVQCFLIQQDAGREALTLPEAQCTIFIDRDFAPGFNDQAEARMTPIDGVPCKKFVIDLIMKSTVEDGIYQLLVVRKESIDTVNSLKLLGKEEKHA